MPWGPVKKSAGFTGSCTKVTDSCSARQNPYEFFQSIFGQYGRCDDTALTGCEIRHVRPEQQMGDSRKDKIHRPEDPEEWNKILHRLLNDF